MASCGTYKLTVFLYNMEVPRNICDADLIVEDINIVRSVNLSLVANATVLMTPCSCVRQFNIGFSENLNRTNPVEIIYSQQGFEVSLNQDNR